MKSFPISILFFTLVSMAPITLVAEQLLFEVDTTTSSVAVEVCAQGECDTDTSPVTGRILLDLDSPMNPTLVSIRNLDIAAIDNFDFFLDYGFLGNITAMLENLQVEHADPGPQQPYFTVVANAYTATNIPYLSSGIATYSASGFVCTLLGDTPCDATIDLSEGGASVIDMADGQIQVVGQEIRFSTQFTFVSLLDPADPSLGMITSTAVINATAPLWQRVLVARESTWNYLDDGSNQGTTWKEPAFNDSSWLSGGAELGYGDGDERTVVSFGLDETNKHVTTYFRHAWTMPDASVVTNLMLRLKRDDGVVVYLNGTEIERSNMPPGTIGHTTLASATAADEMSFFETPVDPTLLVDGLNVVAAEIHQASLTSSDISFDLELLGFVQPPEVTLSIEPRLTRVIVKWPSSATGFELWSTGNLNPPVQWEPVLLTVRDDGVFNSVGWPIASGPRFFQLRAP